MESGRKKLNDIFRFRQGNEFTGQQNPLENRIASDKLCPRSLVNLSSLPTKSQYIV